jgi:2-(3-amino-3-carboxypropyl)histidine synthase
LKIPGYTLDLGKVINKINSKEIKNIIIQIPEGLKIHFSRIVEKLESETDSNIIISGDPCFGACDLIDNKFKKIEIELIIQIGHTPIPSLKKYSSKTEYINAESDIDVSDVIMKAMPIIDKEKIGLVTTAQHIHMLKKVETLLKENNFKPIIGRGDKRIFYPGQIIGCNFTSASSVKNKVDTFLFIGSGSFHPIGLLMATEKPVIACDPYTKEVRIRELNDFKDMILRQRYGAIARSTNAKKFGIIIGAKIGQQRLERALEIKKLLKDNNKKAYLISMEYINSSILESYLDIDCFISTACPRIAIDDYMQYKTPIITPVELEILLKEKKWEEYKFDEIFE